MEDGRFEFLANSVCAYCQGRQPSDIYANVAGSHDVSQFLEDIR